METQSDFDKMLFFEYARNKAEDTYNQNPLDTENLTRWGGALMELAQFQKTVADSKNMLSEGISKLEEALLIEPTRCDTLWCLGNAHTSYAFLFPDMDEAKEFFVKATASFQKAFDLEPENELYRKSLAVCDKAPELHMEIHRARQSVGPSTKTSSKSSKKEGSNDLKYDIFGWVILVVGVFAWVGFAKSHMSPPPTSSRG